MKKNNNNLAVKILGAVALIAVLYFAFSGSDAVMVKVDGSSTVFPITEAIAEEFGKEFLGEIPINPEIGKCGDEGKPIVEANPEHEISKVYIDFAKKIKLAFI